LRLVAVMLGSPLILVVSLNNADFDVNDPAELTTEHAQAWSDMVTRIIEYMIDNDYDQQGIAGISAGIDAEQWGDYDDVETWVRSYMEYPARISPLINFGSIDEYPCSYPQQFPPPHNCGTHGPRRWSDDDYYILSGGLGFTLYPFPQVYKATRARWWEIVARRAYDHHGGFQMDFQGNVWGDVFNSEQSWRLLWLELNSDPATAQEPEWNTVFNNSILPSN
jgi:hypothetical protein